MTDIVWKIRVGIVVVITKDVNHFARNMKKMKIDKYNDFCDRHCKWCTSLVCGGVNDTEARDGCEYKAWHEKWCKKVKETEPIKCKND